jgi:hypothetical protein
MAMPQKTKRSILMQVKALFLAWCFCAVSASAQGLAPTEAAAPCAGDRSMALRSLYGTWRVLYRNPPLGLPLQATLVLQRHAEFSESLAGTVERAMLPSAAFPTGKTSRAALAGDFEEGMLLLDESSNNISITATWNAEAVAGSCGTAFEGLWKDTSETAPENSPEVPFTLRRMP